MEGFEFAAVNESIQIFNKRHPQPRLLNNSEAK